MKSNLFKTSTIGAFVAGLVCIAPPILVVLLGSSVLAFVPSWLDFVVLPIFAVFVGVSIFTWYRSHRTTGPEEKQETIR